MESTGADQRLPALTDRLASQDRAVMSRALDELAADARTNPDALQLLLTTIADRRLAEVSVRKVHFDQARIDDGTQEAILAVAGGISGFRGDSSFLTWLDRVAVNAALAMKRRAQRLSEPVSNDVPEHQEWARRVSSIVADEVMVEQAFAKLTAQHQEVIRLREMEDLSYEDIAAQLELAVGTVRSRLNRARAELAAHLVDAQRGRR
jgi:RNA polymerase sigma-70 factor (ECF subfamily)